MPTFDAAATARLLPARELMQDLATVLAEYGRGEVVSPARLVVPCGDGVLLSMPSHAHDLIAHKLLTVFTANAARGRPAIQGQVTCFDAADGTALFTLDGPTVTARRTAAISMIGIERLARTPPRTMLLIGTGVQAAAHVELARDLFPDLAIAVRGRTPAAEAAFCERLGHPAHLSPAHLSLAGDAMEADVVLAVTSSLTPVYDAAPTPGRLVIGVGAYRLDMVEIGAAIVTGSQVYVDDPVGAPGEAGDIAAAGRDFATVLPLAAALTQPPDFTRPVFLKSVGCGAWDLAACRTARTVLAGS